MSTPSILACQPWPVDWKYDKTSGLYRTETSFFEFGDGGRPRSARAGTMLASCAGVSGCASGSALAAAVIFRSSAMLGILIGVFFKGLDIALNLTTVGAPKADHPSDFAAIYEGSVVQGASLWRKGQDSSLTVVFPAIDPEQGRGPIKGRGQPKRNTVFVDVDQVFGRVELESHALV